MKVAVVTDPPGIPTGGNSNNSFTHVLGSSIMLTCSISSAPAAKSVFKWSCSTGCLVDVEMEQTISVTLQMSGEIVCAYAVDGSEVYSDPIGIIITGKLSTIRTYTVYSYINPLSRSVLCSIASMIIWNVFASQSMDKAATYVVSDHKCFVPYFK